MKQLYESFDKFMIRMPLLPNKDNSESENDLKSICQDKIFREQILVSSKSLYDQMNTYLNNSDGMSNKKTRSFIQAITKYILRRKSRTTPFGLFSSIGIGEFKDSKESDLEFNRDSISKKARVDLEWLFNIIKKIELAEYKFLKFSINAAVYPKGDRACILYNTGGNVNVESIRSTPAFRKTFLLAENPIHFETLINEMKHEYSAVSEDKLTSYITQLIEKEFLISTLRPPLTIADQFEFFLNEYSNCIGSTEFHQELMVVQKLIEEYNSLTIGSGEEKYLELYMKMNDLSRSASPLQVDTYNKTNTVTMSVKQKSEINDVISMLTLLSKNGSSSFEHLDRYIDKFIDRYGVEREVPLMEMLDSNNGLGAPATYAHPYNDYYEPYQHTKNSDKDLKFYCLSKYFNAIQENTSIEIKEEELAGFIDKNMSIDQIPLSLEAYFNIKKKDGRIQLYLGPSGGSHGAGKTFGRFSYLSTEVSDLIKEVSVKEGSKRNKYFKTCETNFIPYNIRNGNVTRNLHYRDRELSLFTSNSKGEKEKIKISDILIGIDKQKFYARNRINGELLVFLSTNMLNTQINNNGIRFLQEIALYGKRNWCDLPWNSYFSDFMHIPEIKYKNIILSLEQWVVSKYDLGYEKNMSYEEFKEKFMSFHSKFNLPETFYLVEFDNRIPISIAADESIQILYRECKKLELRQSRVVLQRIEEGDDPVANEMGESHALEVVIPYFNAGKEEDINVEEKLLINKDDNYRTRLPFDDWLYMKLYVNKDRENELISFDCLDFCENLRKNTGIDYFFMRYVDPKPHIRLRFRAEKRVLLDNYPKILEWLKVLKQKEVISEAVIGTYDREVERYGGPDLIELAENIFISDSTVVEYLLRMERIKDISIPKKHVGIISIIKYLEQFGLTLEEQVKFINSYKRVVTCNDYFRENRDDIISLYRSCEVESSFSEEKDIKKLMNTIEHRSEAIKDFRNSYHMLGEEVKVSYFNVISSIIHLHCNRFFGVDQLMEDEIMSLTAQTLNTLKHILPMKEDRNGKEKLAI